ncbi:MAG: antitermination protein NusG [Planctomycetes bacterium]|nr:antitermination protein NusG [Planctomycetota bacterium]
MAVTGLRKDDAQWEELIQQPPADAIPENLPGAWWVAHTKPRNEKALYRDLRAMGVFAYLPLSIRLTHSRATGRASKSVVPVFTGYVFFVAGDEQRRIALTTNRVAGTLAVPNQLELVGQLRQIQRVLSSRSDFEWGPSLAVGDWVRVVAGSLAGLEGVIVRRHKRTRIALNVEMLAQSVVVEVERDFVEKIDGPSYRAGGSS